MPSSHRSPHSPSPKAALLPFDAEPTVVAPSSYGSPSRPPPLPFHLIRIRRSFDDARWLEELDPNARETLERAARGQLKAGAVAKPLD